MGVVPSWNSVRIIWQIANAVKHGGILGRFCDYASLRAE